MSARAPVLPGAAATPAPVASADELARLRIIPARHPGRTAGTVFSLAVIGLVLHSVFTNPKWGWGVFAEWFFAEPVLMGLGRTLLLTAMGALFGFTLGTLLALARVSRSPLLSGLSFSYVWLFRSIPVLVLLLLVNNLGYLYENIALGIPFTQWTWFSYPTVQLISPFAAAVIGLTLNQSAYSAEIIRGGILSVDQGQLEAAAALGLPRWRQALRIVLPQAMRAILPAGFNNIIGLAKGTSVVYVLAIPDLFYTVQIIYRRNLEVIPLLMVATVWYLVLLTVLSFFQHYIERHYSRGALRNPPPPLFAGLLRRLGFGTRAGGGTAHRDGSAGNGGARDAAHEPARPGLPPDAAPEVSKPSKAGAGPGTPGAGRDTPAPRWADRGVRAGEVRIDRVSKSFGALKVLDDVSLTVPAGCVTVILGQSGSGKSTLLRSINRLEPVDAGFISIDGELVGYRRRGDRLHELGDAEILAQRADVGMVFQSFNLFPHMTVLENLIEAPMTVRGMPRAEAEALARELLARVGLAQKIDAYPRQLSGGQQQRVAIARAMALKPKVLLFDEPTSALDPELVGEVLDVIKELARSGTTLLIVTHEIGFAREVADTVVFMESGRVLESGPPAQVFGAPRHPRTAAFLAKVL